VDIKILRKLHEKIIDDFGENNTGNIFFIFIIVIFFIFFFFFFIIRPQNQILNIFNFIFFCLDVWIGYIEFEKRFNPTDIDRSTMIYLKAKNSLEGDINEEFIMKYTHLLRQQ